MTGNLTLKSSVDLSNDAAVKAMNDLAVAISAAHRALHALAAVVGVECSIHFDPLDAPEAATDAVSD